MKNISALLFFTLISAVSHSQEEEEMPVSDSEKGFYIGINTGGCLANKYTAGYYGGNGEYSVYDLIANPYIYNQIYNKFQNNFYVGEMPLEVKYKPGIAVGLHLGLYTDATSAFFTDINFIRLTVAAPFALYSTNPNNPNGDPIIHPETFIGEENRLSIDLGYHSDFGEEDIRGYAEFGGNFNAVKPVKNNALIEGTQYGLMQSSYAPYNLSLDRGGVGYGFFLGTGVRMKFNQKYTFDIGATVTFQRINLYLEEKMKLNPVIYLRLLYL